MSQRELFLKKISNELSKWEVRISHLNSISLYDINNMAENTACELLNAIFGYQLVNINSETPRHIAIDLGDKSNKIAYQVTSTKGSKKIRESLKKFFENDYHKCYDDLFVLILGQKQKKYPDFLFEEDFNFDSSKHIIDFRDLLRSINYLPISKIKKIYQILIEENSGLEPKFSINNAKRVKKNLALKAKIKRELLITLLRNNLN